MVRLGTEHGRIALAHPVIRAEMDRLCARHALDSVRVCRIVERCGQRYGSRFLDEHPETLATQAIVMHALAFIDEIEEALQYQPPDAALAIFECTDAMLDTQGQRVSFVRSSVNTDLPLYTLDRLTELTAALPPLMEQNRARLLASGLPQVAFSRSHWLDCRLNRLYDVLHPREGITIYDERGNLTYSIGALEPDSAYDEGVSPADAARLASGRAAFFDLKVAIVSELLTAMRARSARNLWPNCLRLLTQYLTADDVAFYLHLDRLLLGFDPRTAFTIPYDEAGCPRGGLTDLLMTIGHYEQELLLGVCVRMQQALGQFLAPNPVYIPEFTVMSYYQVIGRPDQERLDTALDACMALGPASDALWSDYLRRVDVALDGEFRVKVVFEEYVKQRLVPQYEPFARAQLKLAQAQLEAGGTLPPLALTVTTQDATKQMNSFCKEGKYYTIRFEGRVVCVPTTVGWRYIEHLIRHEGREFQALQLAMIVRGQRPENVNAQLSALSGEALAELGLSVSGFGDAGERLSQQAINEYRQARRDYQEDLRQAEATNDEERIAQAKAALAFLEQEVIAAVGLGGRKRKAADTKEKARKAVSIAVTRSLQSIRGDYPALYEHLDAALKCGDFFLYEPATSPHWQL